MSIKLGGHRCCVVGCENVSSETKGTSVRYFVFPKRNFEQSELWRKAVNRANPDGSLWMPKPHSRICSAHFVGGKHNPTRSHPDYVPSIFPYVRSSQVKSRNDVKRYDRLKNRSNIATVTLTGTRTLNTNGTPSTPSTSGATEIPDFNGNTDGNFHCTQETSSLKKKTTCNVECQTDLEFDGPTPSPVGILWCEKYFPDYDDSCTVGTQVNLSIIRNDDGNLESKEHPSRISSNCAQSNICGDPAFELRSFTDRQFKAFTGTSKNIFNFLLDALSQEVPASRKLQKSDKLALFLMKLKLNLTFTVLSAIFNISDGTAGHYFYQVLNAMTPIARFGVCWFDKANIQARMPSSFRSLYPDARCIIDASEVYIQRPSTQRQRIQTYSHYKSHFTIKFLVACAPSGEITFISPAYGGRTTDTEITVRSGFLDLLEAGDVVLADKGFPNIRSNVQGAGGLLVMPPFARKGRQFSASENKDAYECASVRIHVERCIARMKLFNILNYLPNRLLKSIDDILLVISFIVNCYPDLIKQDQ